MEDDPHPLALWLETKGISALEFSEQQKLLGNRLNFSTLYAHIRGDREPTTRVLMAIEDATGGEVTMRQQVDWFRSRAV